MKLVFAPIKQSCASSWRLHKECELLLSAFLLGRFLELVSAASFSVCKNLIMSLLMSCDVWVEGLLAKKRKQMLLIWSLSNFLYRKMSLLDLACIFPQSLQWRSTNTSYNIPIVSRKLVHLEHSGLLQFRLCWRHSLTHLQSGNELVLWNGAVNGSMLVVHGIWALDMECSLPQWRLSLCSCSPYWYHTHTLSWCRVYWLHHSPHGSLVTENARQLRTHSNSQQKRSGRRGVSHWSTEVAEYKSNRHTPGTKVPKRKYSNRIGEQDNPRTTVTCSPHSRIPSQHLETSQATPFHSL